MHQQRATLVEAMSPPFRDIFADVMVYFVTLLLDVEETRPRKCKQSVLQRALTELANSILKLTAVINQAELTLGNAPSTVIILNCLILFSNTLTV